jgi:hypothetical protein
MAFHTNLPDNAHIRPSTNERDDDFFIEHPSLLTRDQMKVHIDCDYEGLRALDLAVKQHLNDKKSRLDFSRQSLIEKRVFMNTLSNTQLVLFLINSVFFNIINLSQMATIWLKDMTSNIESLMAAIWNRDFALRIDSDNIYFFPNSYGSSLGIPIRHLSQHHDMRLFCVGEIMSRQISEKQALFRVRNQTLDGNIVMFEDFVYDPVFEIIDISRLTAHIITNYIQTMPTQRHELICHAFTKTSEGIIPITDPRSSQDMRRARELQNLEAMRKITACTINESTNATDYPKLDVTSLHRFMFPMDYNTPDAPVEYRGEQTIQPADEDFGL